MRGPCLGCRCADALGLARVRGGHRSCPASPGLPSHILDSPQLAEGAVARVTKRSKDAGSRPRSWTAGPMAC